MHDETEAGKPLGEMDAATGPNKSLGVSRKSAAAGARWAAPESSVQPSARKRRGQPGWFHIDGTSLQYKKQRTH